MLLFLNLGEKILKLFDLILENLDLFKQVLFRILIDFFEVSVLKNDIIEVVFDTINFELFGMIYFKIVLVNKVDIFLFFLEIGLQLLVLFLLFLQLVLNEVFLSL